MAAAEDSVRYLSRYVPRAQFVDFHNRHQRWAAIVAHRRAGKTVACVMELITRALATSKVQAQYAYIAPFREQAKTVAWHYLKYYAEPVILSQDEVRESELSVKLANGSSIRIFGADNPNALRGMYLDGVVMDEFADMRPALWGEVIRPTLSDRSGWAVFIGTPRGRNAFYELLYGTDDRAGAFNDDAWFTLTLKASETGIIARAELEDARKTMSENQYLQEYECSFEAAVIGAVYAKELQAARGLGQITNVPHDGSRLVNTAWDIGVGDATAIWFYQMMGTEIHVIDYYEASGESSAFYAGILHGKSYNYDTAYLPHDAQNRQIVTGKSFEDAIRQAGLKVSIVPKAPLEHGINAARQLFPRCVFDDKRCRVGIDALQNYRWDYNHRMGELKPTPVHDWSSHGADAFRYLAMSVKAPQHSKPKLVYPKRPYA